jgi:hypothetical protein
MKRTGQGLQIWKLMLPLGAMLALALPAFADEVKVPKGTDVVLAFDQTMTDQKAKDGDKVKLHVDQDVLIDGKIVITSGTKVSGTITSVKKRARFGVNARVQMLLKPIKTVDGSKVVVGYNTRSGSNGKTAGAAAASAGGALILGPVGLVGGYFIVGKHVNVKPGDKMTVNTDKDAMVHVK